METTTTNTTNDGDRLRAEASQHEQDAHDSFERCDTDGFVSQWASGITGRQKRAQADIIDAGGVSDFPALFDLDGQRVPAKLIDGRYGMCWALVEAGSDRFTGEFVSAFPKRESTMAKKGYVEGREIAPAKAVIAANGTGLSGAASAYVRVVRIDDGTGQDERVAPFVDDEDA